MSVVAMQPAVKVVLCVCRTEFNPSDKLYLIASPIHKLCRSCHHRLSFGLSTSRCAHGWKYPTDLP